LSSASARHSAATRHGRQIAAACLCAAPRTNRSSGLVKRHRACDTQPMREWKRAGGAGAGVTRPSYQQSRRVPPHRQLVDESSVFSTLMVANHICAADSQQIIRYVCRITKSPTFPSKRPRGSHGRDCGGSAQGDVPPKPAESKGPLPCGPFSGASGAV
jgi:hypothetical protein